MSFAQIAATWDAIRSPRTVADVQARIAHCEQTLALPDTYYVLDDGSVGGGNSHKRAQAGLEHWKSEPARMEGRQGE